MSAENEKGKRELEEKIKELEEKVKKLEQEKSKEPEAEKEEPESTAGSVLERLGGILPGIGGLIEGLEKSDAFRERLKEIDMEIETRLKTGILESPGESGRRGGRAPILGKPPGARPRPAKTTAPLVRRPPPVTVEEPSADIFEDEYHLKVVAELPGIEEKDIKVDLNDNELIISADTPDRKYHKEIVLPSLPESEIDRTYRNGILEITLKKDSTAPS